MSLEGARFCAACGASLEVGSAANATQEAERRLISVMLCDLVGSTALSGRLDPEELAEVIGSYQSRVAKAVADFGGYVANHVGDGILSYFGWPESQEANSERAVRAALAAVSALEAPIRGENLQAHIGIATGTVVVGDRTGFGDARQQTAIGETPNLAARLEEIAEPDTVVIDDATRRQIGGLFACRDLGELTLKGFRMPVRAWRVLGERAIGDRFAALHTARLVPLVDREDELALLLDRWRLAKQGRGQLVLLEGEPGIGKSRLVAELRSRLRGEPHASLRYFCSPHYQASPLYPIITRLEYEAGIVRRDGPMDRLRKLETALLPAGLSESEIALMADLLGLPASELSKKIDLSPQGRKQRTFEILLRRVGDLAKRRPPVLILAEDAHWADPSSMEVLERLIGVLSDLPILLIVSFRGEFAPPWVGLPNVTLISLSRLSRSDAKRLATEVMIRHVLPPALLDRIVTQSDGVPLFIEELTKSVLESAVGQGTSSRSLTVPGTLRGLLTARLDRLPAAKRVAQIGATIGREFSQSLLAAVARISDADLLNGLDELVGSGLASRHGELTDTTYIFKHALVQEAIYDTVLRRRRAEIHARIVAAAEADASFGVTEPGLLGYHCTQAGLLAKAASYYRIAGGRSAERAAVAETRIYLERGLQTAGNLPDGPDRHRLEAELLIALGRILMATKGPSDPEAGVAFRRAVTVCRRLGSPEMLARALYSLGIIAETCAELSEAQSIGEELYTLAADSGDEGIAIAARVRLGILAYYRGQFIAARTHLAEALTLCASGKQELRDSAIASDPHFSEANLSLVMAHLGQIEEALTHGHSAADGAQRSGASSPAYALVLSIWSRTLEVMRDEVGYRACSEMLVQLCEEQGFSFLLAVGQCQLGWVMAKQGHIEQGMTLLSTGVSSLQQAGARIRPALGKFLMADVLALAGRHGAALAMLDEVLEFSRTTGACWLDAELYRKRSELLLAIGNADTDQVEHELYQAMSIAREQSARLFELRAATSLARLQSDRGGGLVAADLLRPLIASFSDGPEIPDVRDARAMLGHLDETSPLE
jgi:class 3 adenylate cyclase/tetratricopeptide (TPR) repeat protein